MTPPPACGCGYSRPLHNTETKRAPCSFIGPGGRCPCPAYQPRKEEDPR